MDTQLLQPHHDRDVQQSLQFLRNELSNTNDDSPIPCPNFISKSLLRQYFKRERGSLDRLLRAVIEKEEDIQDVDNIHDNFLSVFAILLDIGFGAFLPRFVERDWCDSQLPIEAMPPGFPVVPNTEFFDLFYAHQFQFRPQTFTKGFHGMRLGSERVLPIVYKEKLKESTPATIYKVRIHEDHDQLLRTASESSKLVETNKNLKHTYIFKEFTGAHAYNAYTKERTAFNHLRSSQQLGKTIIGYYGSFSQDETHVLILEYADRGTLDEFLQALDPPSQGPEVMKLWKSLLAVQHALYYIHDIPTATSNLTHETKEFSALRGWHSDLKPANILVVSGSTDSPYDCEFRLADLGTSHFTRLAQFGYDFRASDEGGTKQFGAPECYLGDLLQHRPLVLPQKADIWSLGCIYSEFGVWIVLGRKALSQYQDERLEETEQLGIKHVGCFHDGENPLPCVKRWHNEAFSNKRSNDHVTKGILRKLVDEMLYADADARPTAKQLENKARDIFSKADEHVAWLERHPSMASDSTIHLPHRYQPRKRARRHQEVQDDSSDDGSQASISVEPSPSRNVTAARGHARQMKTSADTTFSDTNAFGTPERSDADHGTRDTTPMSEALSPKSGTHFERPHIDLRPSNERMRYSSDITRSPDVLNQPRQFLFSDDGGSIDPTDATMHDLSSVQQNDDRMANVPDTPTLVTPGESRPVAKPKPSLTLDRGLIYYSEKKKRKPVSLNDEGYMGLLARPERDFMFLIDDSRSMKPYAGRVYETIQFLAWLLKPYDKDGLELLFMRNQESHKSDPGVSSTLLPPLSAAMRNCQGTSDVTHRLGEILHTYQNRLSRSQQSTRFPTSFGEIFQKKIKPLSIYILTDGEWEEGSDPSDLLIKTAQFLDHTRQQRIQLGIQFIRFGNKPENIAKLEHLDSGLGVERDMVDTESIDGNVYKMLLGPISPSWDGDKLRQGRFALESQPDRWKP